MNTLDIICVVALAFLAGVVVGMPDKSRFYK